MKKISIALVSSLLMLSLLGCANNGQATNNAGKVNTGTPSNMNATPTGNANKNMNASGKNATSTSLNDDELRSTLQGHIGMVEGVNDSALVINERDIIVGLDVDNKADRAKIEQEIQQMIQNDHAGGVYNVYVTSDTSFYDRIRTLGDQMNPLNGEPVKDFANDIQTLINDIGQSIENAIK